MVCQVGLLLSAKKTPKKRKKTEIEEKRKDYGYFFTSAFWPIPLTISCCQLQFKMPELPSFTFIYLEISVMAGTMPQINQKALKDDSVKVVQSSVSVVLVTETTDV